MWGPLSGNGDGPRSDGADQPRYSTTHSGFMWPCTAPGSWISNRALHVRQNMLMCTMVVSFMLCSFLVVAQGGVGPAGRGGALPCTPSRGAGQGPDARGASGGRAVGGTMRWAA